MKPTLDRSAAPLLVATFYPSITIDEARAHFREVSAAAEDFGRVGVVIDLSNPPRFSWSLGRAAAEEKRVTLARHADRIVAVAHVTRSAAARATLAAMQWLAPHTVPTLATTSYEEASAWVKGMLGRAPSESVLAGRRDARATGGLARAVLNASRKLGTPIDDFALSRLGVTRSGLENLDAYVASSTVLGLIELLSERSDDANIGLRIGSEFIDSATLGVVGAAAQASTTLASALSRLERSARLIDENLQLSVSAVPEGTRIVLKPQAPITWPRHYSELTSAALFSLCRAWTSVHFDALAVGFRHEAPAHAQPHRGFFGCDPRFGAEEDFFIIPTELLAQPLAGRDPARECYFDARLQEMDRTLSAAPGALANVRLAARALLSKGVPTTIATVSRYLGLSSRTLQRRLNERGVTFGDLVDSIRREAALDAVARTNVSVQEMAKVAGFIDVKSFRRAFVRWTGQPPSEYRRSRHL